VLVDYWSSSAHRFASKQIIEIRVHVQFGFQIQGGHDQSVLRLRFASVITMKVSVVKHGSCKRINPR
jgi:hypothetical protein